ncbi:unnamed protein product [Brassicogethes aeneus]|uniref:Ubiquitin-like domain-containing protein n=1 Tax=Brassicogethes aeneus TaxID=1431903 RepID=A0A9P0FE67_BRAAE|nr:unnamed protein product [Brassicogethes aeneus]
MTLIEGIGDEVTHFFIGLFVILTVSIAWWTTNISEQRHIRTVLLLDRRHRNPHRSYRTLTNHTESVTITEGTPAMSRSASEGDLNRHIEEVSPSPETSSTVKPEEGTSAEVQTSSTEETEQNSIIETMDSENCELRQRRIAFYDNCYNTAGGNNGNAQTHTESNETETIMEHNYAERKNTTEAENKTETNAEKLEINENSIIIKLKYINDDLKPVNGNLEELLGDFKKRHFETELNSNKLVRLIFNGHVLQQDAETLRKCGLFDNCVVHCLIHPKRTPPGGESGTSNRGSTDEQNAQEGLGVGNSNNNQQRDWDLGNILFGLISFVLIAAWYFRYVYAHLYTVTATVGLIVITGIFTVVLIGMHFPDNEPQPRITIHATRVQQPAH